MLAAAARRGGLVLARSPRPLHRSSNPLLATTTNTSSRDRQPIARRRMSAAAGGDQSPGGSLEQMSVNELQELLANPVLCEEVQFIDVREPWEHDTAKLPLFKLLPLSQASSWAATIDQDLDPDTETVVLCHHGMRSMQMAGFLLSKGFKTVKNVTGGIAAYSIIDRNIPEY